MGYKLIKNPRTGKTDQCIQYTDSTNVIKFIPYDPENTDYQKYLKWVAAGNTAEAAD
jgi:hypothetical protein